MKESNKFCVIYNSIDDKNLAGKLSALIISQKLAACCSIIPNITSVFEWEGKIETRNEYILMIKTKSEKFDEIKQLILANHNDSVPEIIMVPIDKGLDTYLSWIDETLS